MPRLCITLTLCAALSLAAQSGVWAQDMPAKDAFVMAYEAFEAGDFGRAAEGFAAIVADEPAYVAPDGGSAAYWLGQSYVMQQQHALAVEAWATGWDALRQQERVDIRLADALVTYVFALADEQRFRASVAAYEMLLRLAEHPAVADHAELYAAHLIPLTFVLPDSLSMPLGLHDAEAAAHAVPLPSGASARLLAWWRREDPKPATKDNERLIEHLQRVAYANRHFADSTAASGYDDRGPVYLRLGAPRYARVFSLAQEAVSAPKMTVGLGDGTLSTTWNEMGIEQGDPFVPVGLFWSYGHVHDAAQYLFIIDRRRGYRLGRPADLVPISLRSKRGDPRLLTAMSEIYRTMALMHPEGHYGSAYEEIENYRGLQADVALARTMRSPRSTYTVQLPSPQGRTFSILSRARGEDRKAIRYREEAVPQAYSNVFDDVEPLPTHLRWARFLDRDGTTRTEVYWTLPTSQLRPSRRMRRQLRRAGHKSTDQYVLDLSLVQQRADYLEHRRDTRHHLIDLADHRGAADMLRTQTLTSVGDTGRYHLALQWDAHWAEPGGRDGKRGPQIKLGAMRLEDLQALPAHPGHLAISDLKPLVLSEGAPVEEATPYPYRTLSPDTPLALYFEVYHLHFDATDRTRYSIAYQVERRTAQGVVERLLRRNGDVRTTTRSAYIGAARRTEEYIVLDLSTWNGTSALTITVEVTDETTGKMRSRVLDFDVEGNFE